MENTTVPDSKSKKKRKNKKKTGTGGIQNSTEDAAQRQDVQSENKPDNEDEDSDASEPERDESDAKVIGTSTETSVDDEAVAALANGTSKVRISEDVASTTARFEAMVKERDSLREEVTKLRESLEQLQSKHSDEVEEMQNQLQETQSEKENAEENYQNLLGKVNTIRSQLGERLKADAEELAQARTRIEELEEQKSDLQEQYTTRSAEVEELRSKNDHQTRELDELRSRSSLSQQNWVKEREELVEQETYMREEFESAKQAMHDWEVLAMEERSIRRDLSDRVTDLEEQLNTVKGEYERAANDRDSQSSTVDGLQRAMQEIQNARKKELRELVESTQTETQSLRKQLEEMKNESEKRQTDLEETKKELDRALPFEKEVKEKNLLIGKLRHEAVILNDHLTKALRFLKKGKPEDNVDRQIVTNHFLHFLALDRSDPKKFQILQLIAALLSWNDEQKEQAGLARPGGGGSSNISGSLRLPGTPMMHRTPSTPALNQSADYNFPDSATSPSGKESLAELWQNFLEQEATSNTGPGGSKSRVGSISNASTSAPPPVPPKPS